MARRTKEEAEQTRKDILQASLDMFCEKGYTRTTLDDIAKSINMTKGAIYWYFRNKPDILKALMLEDFKSTQAKLEAYMPSPQTLEELKLHFMYLSKMVDEDSNFRKLLYFLTVQMEWSNGLLNSFKDLLDEFRSRPRNTILNVLQAEQKCGNIDTTVDLNSLACTIHCLWHGLMCEKFSHQDTVCFAKELSFSFDFLIKALVTTKD